MATVVQTEGSDIERRLDAVNRMVAALRKEFSDEELSSWCFAKDLWLVAQIISGQDKAAAAVRQSQVS